MVSYGTVDEEPKRSKMIPRYSGFVLMGLAVVVGVTAWQSGGFSSRSELSEEIGAFGTGLDDKSSNDADTAYENTFSNDPGHISRAEIRFNQALRAAGMPASSTVKPILNTKPAPRPASSTQSDWTAFPEPRRKEDVTVNLYGYGEKRILAVPAPAPAAPRRLGMSSREAQKDLLGYFDGIDNQIHSEERKHAQYELNRLGGQSKLSQLQGPEDNVGDAVTDINQIPEVRRSRGRGRQTNSILRLLRKAMRTDEFKREVASAVGQGEGQ